MTLTPGDLKLLENFIDTAPKIPTTQARQGIKLLFNLSHGMTKNVFLNFSGESEELGKDIRSGIYANAALNDLCKQLGLSKKFSGFGVPANQDSHVVICDEIYPPSGAVFKNVDLAALKATQHLEV